MLVKPKCVENFARWAIVQFVIRTRGRQTGSVGHTGRHWQCGSIVSHTGFTSLISSICNLVFYTVGTVSQIDTGSVIFVLV